jgi:hypothetical protein
LEPLDQQALLQEVTSTLVSASKGYALTQNHGSTTPPISPYKKTITTGLLILIFCTPLSPLYSNKSQITEYSGFHNKYPIHITYTFTDTKKQPIIKADIQTEKIKEHNITTLKDNQLHTMTQTTHNEIDGEYFTWTVQHTSPNYTIEFHNTRYNETFKGHIPDKRRPFTLQGLLYLIRNKDLNINDKLKANLLIPWKTIIPIRLIVEDTETITLNTIPTDAIKLRFEIDLFFGHALPKSYIWVSKQKPHILLKQTGLNKSYNLTDIK